MPDATAPFTAQTKNFALAAAVLTLAAALPLWRLVRFAVADEFYSFIPLMPLVSGYLIWTQKEKLPRDSAPTRKLAAFFFVAGITAAVGYFSVSRFAALSGIENRLALATLAWLLSLTGAGCWFLGGATGTGRQYIS